MLYSLGLTVSLLSIWTVFPLCLVALVLFHPSSHSVRLHAESNVLSYIFRFSTLRNPFRIVNHVIQLMALFWNNHIVILRQLKKRFGTITTEENDFSLTFISEKPGNFNF